MTGPLKSFINGKFVLPADHQIFDTINPAMGTVSGQVAMATPVSVDEAVTAARSAVPAMAASTPEQRHTWLKAIAEGLAARADDLAQAITLEMGAPNWLAHKAQVPAGIAHLKIAASALKTYAFERPHNDGMIVEEPIGVCGLITPWNWPLNQITCKLAPAIATGCPVVWKPSEYAAHSAQILAEVISATDLPQGAFNMVYGDGPGVGAAMAAHQDIDLISFTGSTGAGVAVAQAAAPSVKRVHQELGGKSPYLVMPNADLKAAVVGCARSLFLNSGQSCNAPTRLLVPHDKMDAAAEIAAGVAAKTVPGHPDTEDMVMGPVVNQAQRNRIRQYIEAGQKEGAKLVAGGAEHPKGCPEGGFYIRSTVFAHVRNDMTIAREEIFGPVLCIIGYETLEEAITIANDTPYGLAAYVMGPTPDAAKAVARRIKAGQVLLNNAQPDFTAPFGGYKMSGNGREWGIEAFQEFSESKAIII